MDSPLRRIAVIALLSFLTAVPFAFASEPVSASTTPKAPLRSATHAPVTLVVPDVQGQAYVFAEGALEDAGFSWYVTGRNGFSSSTVVAQSPAPGTRVVDTGAPLVTLRVTRNRDYGERGTAENKSPDPGTAVRPVTS
jgi:hypothetical protein